MEVIGQLHSPGRLALEESAPFTNCIRVCLDCRDGLDAMDEINFLLLLEIEPLSSSSQPAYILTELRPDSFGMGQRPVAALLNMEIYLRFKR
jgi:hypothetical protein